MIATTKTPATQLAAKTSWNSCGVLTKMSLTCVKPMPIDKLKAAMVRLRCVKPARSIIWKPATTILPNIMIVQPPKTASGRLLKTAATAGTKAAATKMMAPVAIARRLTTPVRPIKPTFWLKEVMGVEPRQPPKALMKPSQAIEPESSFLVTWRCKPEMASALVSPMVSVADTKKMMATVMMGPTANCGVSAGSKKAMAGRLSKWRLLKPEKSTTPNGIATM